MAANEVREIDIRLNANTAIRDLTRLAGKLDDLSVASLSSDRAINSAERRIQESASSMRTAASVVGQLQNRIKELEGENRGLAVASRASAAEVEKVSGSLRRLQSITGINDRALQGLQRAETSAITATTALTKLEAGWLRLQKLPDITAAGNALEGTLSKQGRFKYGGYDVARANDDELAALQKLKKEMDRDFWGEVNGEIEKRANATKDAAAATDTLAESSQKAGTTLRELTDITKINALRYALYDVSNTFGRIRDMALGAVTGTLGIGIEYERNFANVLRTSQVTGGAVDALRKQFLDLQTSIPVSSEDLATIGTLGAQMGIAAGDLAHFTQVVAKFAATAGISADEAATAIARIGQLSNLPADDYDRLASAILKTGVNAIATEQQIVRGTTQIAAIGKVAGLSTTDVIALSSAMSSLGMSPELQRSIITSSFTKILSAVRGSTAAAEKFGRVLGQTGEEFQSSWNNDAYGTYTRLLGAIAESDNAIGILQDLGLASQRLTPNLLKLGQQTDLLAQTQRDTETGWKENAELTRQYDIIAQTTAANLEKLKGAWEEFLTVIGSDGVTALGGIAVGLTNVLKVLSDFSDNPVAKVFLDLVGVAAVVIGALAAVAAGAALLGAGLLGLIFVQRELSNQLGKMNLQLSLTGLKLKDVAAATLAARVSFTALSVATKALGLALASLTAVSLALSFDTGLTKFERDIAGASSSVTALRDELTGATSGSNRNFDNLFVDMLGNASSADMYGRSLKDANAAQIGFLRGLGGFGGGAWGNIRLLDESLRDLASTDPSRVANELDALFEAWERAGGTSETFRAAFTDAYEALEMSSGKYDASAEEIDAYYNTVDEAAAVEAQHAVQLDRVAERLGLSARAYGTAEDAVASFMSAFQTGASGFFDFGQMLEDIYGQGGTGGGIAKFARDLAGQTDSFKTWEQGLRDLGARGAGNLVSAFAAQGPSSSRAIADALKMGPEALASLEQNMADAALFMSEAFAEAFAQDTAAEADIYAKVYEIDPTKALDAVHKFREDLRSGDAITPEELLGLQEEYGFTADLELVPTITAEDLDLQPLIDSAEPIIVPVTTKLRDPYTGAEILPGTNVLQYLITDEEGDQILLPVSPETEKGKEMLAEWRAAEYKDPADIQIKLDETSAALFRARVLELVAGGIAIPAFPTSGNGGTGGPGTRGGGRKDGGLLAFAHGGGPGMFRGPGSGTSDSILARVSNGEYINTARSVRYYGAKFFDDLNRMRLPRYDTGGLVGAAGGNGYQGPQSVTNVQVTQNYPQTVHPLDRLREESENLVAGIWG